MNRAILLVAMFATPMLGRTAAPAAPVTTDNDGTVHVSELAVPLSVYTSAKARQTYLDLSRSLSSHRGLDESQITHIVDGLVAEMKAAYPVKIESTRIAGIPVLIALPAGGVSLPNRDRVLINLHGGGNSVPPPEMNQMLESVPIAAVSGIKVISVGFRVAPKDRFPAANEDILAVYTELLKRYDPANIGIYGCSFGGILTAEAVAWFQRAKLPRPGAIGIFCAGAEYPFGGDSAYWAPPLFADGTPPAASPNPPSQSDPDDYFSTADFTSALVSPLRSPEVLARFPPTLIVTGTRDFMLSTAVHTHAALLRAGVEAELLVEEGMWHAFMYSAGTAESEQMYAVTARFFQTHLGRRRKVKDP